MGVDEAVSNSNRLPIDQTPSSGIKNHHNGISESFSVLIGWFESINDKRPLTKLSDAAVDCN